MPAEYHAFPPSAYDVKIVRNGYEYPIDIDTHGFTRTGVDGAEKVIALFTDEEFKAEYLEPSWKKGWDSDISTFTSIVDTTNDHDELSGVAAVGGTTGRGWTNSNQILPLIGGLQLTVAMVSPVDDSGAAADRDIFQYFLLVPTKVETQPDSEDDYLTIRYNIDESGLLLEIKKKVATTVTTIFDGSTYDDASVRATGNLEATIWRIVFHESDSDTAYRHMHVYLKQSDTLSNAEAATENELSTSPYDISGLLFKWAYPCLQVDTQNTTYYGAFGGGNEAVYSYIRVKYADDTDYNYPPFDWRYKTTGGDDYLDGGVELWDGDPDSGGVQVFDEDHVFSNDIYIQNGLTRVKIDEGANYGFQTYSYFGAAWTQVFDKFIHYLNDSSQNLNYPALVKVKSISTEKTSLRIKLTESATLDDNYYSVFDLTIRRGSYYYELELVEVYPIQESYMSLDKTSQLRWGYVGNEKIGDDDVGTASQTNTTMTDNFAVCFDNAGNAALAFFGASQKPNGTNKEFRSYEGGELYYEDIAVADISSTILFIGIIPFSLVANLFKEAEDATISAAARLYLDGAGEDTCTEGQAVWAATANCVVDVNDVAMPPQVGAKDVKITSSAGGVVQATCTPAAPLGKLVKFDLVKFWAKSPDAPLAADRIYLVDADGDSVRANLTITTGATQLSVNIPHNAADLVTYGWTEAGTFDYSTLTAMIIEWTAAGAGEIVYVDGLHEYIGTTTTRGRGETLSGGSAVVLDAQNEYVISAITAGTHLPEGYYLQVIRAKDTDQVVNDCYMHAYNVNDAQYRNKEGAPENLTLTSAFAYYVQLMHISADDVSGGNSIRIPQMNKNTAGENTVFVDYFLRIFLGDGENGAMDLAHSALRSLSRPRRLYAL